MSAGRIIDVADAAVALNVRDRQLKIRLGGAEVASTPLADLAALVISNPAVVMTQAVISGLAEYGGIVVVCDRSHMPAAMMLPVQAHVTQSERFATQSHMSKPFRNRLWKQVVRAKISAQARLLTDLHGEDGGLAAMAMRVRSGDAGFLEARAAQIYWPRLFADPLFRRGREGPDQNSHLNYGYAVLRALVARAICGAGLHPSLGLRHHNRYDPFCLANDLMEPFRPIVDRAVHAWIQEHDPAAALDREAKAWLIRPMTASYPWAGEVRSLFDLVAMVASSLARALAAPRAALEIAEV